MTEIFADEQKQTPERFLVCLPASVAANFSPDFIKTTVLLAFTQIRREHEVQSKVYELQPIVCLLLIFYFLIE
jgi:hypothetical protein